jgi:hypothetical protein
VAAGVHQALGPGGIREIGRLLDRQRVHVRAQPDRLDVALAGGLVALDDPTTPVRPRPVITSSQPNSRKRSATNAAVRCTS